MHEHSRDRRDGGRVQGGSFTLVQSWIHLRGKERGDPQSSGKDRLPPLGPGPDAEDQEDEDDRRHRAQGGFRLHREDGGRADRGAERKRLPDAFGSHAE